MAESPGFPIVARKAQEVFMLAALSIALTAGIPPGSSRPSWGVVLFAVVLLGLLIALNTVWEKSKGPPSP